MLIKSFLDTFSIFFIHIPLSIVLSIFTFILSLSMPFSIFPVTIINLPIWIYVPSSSILNIILPFSFIESIIRPKLFANSISDSIFHIAIVFESLWKSNGSISHPTLIVRILLDGEI